MHFNVIQISENPVHKDDRIDMWDIAEDPLFLDESDYGGDEKKYSDVIESIKRELEPFCVVNKKKRTITFRPKKTVEREWLQAIDDTLTQFKENIRNKAYSTAEYQLRSHIREPHGVDDLFYNRYCRKFSSVIADYLAGYLPKTLYIGAILDAHC